jgi:hypothetical protein
VWAGAREAMDRSVRSSGAEPKIAATDHLGAMAFQSVLVNSRQQLRGAQPRTDLPMASLAPAHTSPFRPSAWPYHQPYIQMSSFSIPQRPLPKRPRSHPRTLFKTTAEILGRIKSHKKSHFISLNIRPGQQLFGIFNTYLV